MVGAIEFKGVKKSFKRPDGEIVHALNGVDLKIDQGDFVCLIGPSGCGKSTMLRLNIYDNISFGLKARHIFKEKRDSVKEFVDLVGLSGFEKSYPHQLSGGMCQRASLARALIGHPKALLLDEPLGALDAFTRMNMQDELLRIKAEQNMTMVMVTHDVDEAVYLSNKIVVMSPRPAKIEEVLEVHLSSPRDRNNPEFIRLRNEILKILNFAGREKDVEYTI